MELFKNIIILVIVLVMGAVYYVLSISRNDKLNHYSFFMKIELLILSFVLAFAEKDFIVIGDLAFGGRTPVMMLIFIEIADALIDMKKNKKK